ncbi:MAG TPA: XTP/dITP diphosphatase [Chloroflexi bacterium]|jgi:XTP/dITP diphosphohydrolase|nr:XTP/dITP diphosphatase [Chloroflexota bacterium]
MVRAQPLRVLIATHNEGKKREYAELLADTGAELVSLADVGIEQSIPEEGETYAENAVLKARGYAALSGMLTLADDSGIEVDALGGGPGVHTARYVGEGASDADRNALLLRSVAGVPEEARTARFRCVIALAWPSGRTEVVEGVVEGRIAPEPRGEHGFGYDPIFYVPAYGRTMAELPEEVKNRISHRARAAAAAAQVLAGAAAANEG